MNNEIIYSKLDYTTDQIRNAIANSLNIERVISDKAYNFVELTSYESLNQATKPNTIYFVETEAYSYLVFVLYQGDIITQIAMVSDGNIRYRTGTIQIIQSKEVFFPNTEFTSILGNYYNKEEIQTLFFEVNERLGNLETPAHVVSGTQKSLVGITTLQTEAGEVSDNKIVFGLAGAALIDIQGYVDIAFECSSEIDVYIDDEKVYYFDHNTWSYIGSPEFMGNISKGIRVTCTGNSSITFTKFSVPSFKGGILSDEQAEKVIKTEVFTKAEKDKLASSEVFTSDEKKELARVSSISDAGYVYIDTSLIDLKNKGILVTDAIVEEKTLTGEVDGLSGTEAVISLARYVKMHVSSGRRSLRIFVDGTEFRYGAGGIRYEGYVDEIKIVDVNGLAVTFKTLEVAEFHGGHVTGEQVLDVEILKTNMNTAQNDISGIEGQLANIYTKEETKAEISREIADLAETSAETLETLEKLKEALGDGTESITAITDELTKKMEKAEIQAISDVNSPTVVYLYNGSEEDVPFTSATIFSLKTTKTRFALASDGKIYYQTYLREEVSAEDATQTILIYSEWFEVSPEKVIKELSQRVSKLEVPAHEELVETTLEEIATPEEGGGVVSGNTWSDNEWFVPLYLNVPGRVSFDVVENTNTQISIDGVLLEGNTFDGNVANQIILAPTTMGSNSITFGTIKITKYHGGILTDEQAEKVIRTEVLTTPEKNKLAEMKLYTASEKYHVERLSKITDAGYTLVDKTLIELQNEGMLIASEGVVVEEDKFIGDKYSEVTINVDANIYMHARFGGDTDLYIDEERIGVANGYSYEYSYEGYVHNVVIKAAGFSFSALNVIFKIAQYNGGYMTDEQTQDIEQVKHDTEWNAKNIDTLNTKAEAIKGAKATRNTIRLNNLYSNGQITNDTSELTCALRSIEAPLGGDTIIQYTGKARLALDPVENLALYIDDVLIEDNEFYGTINNNITLKDNGTGGYTANFSYIQSLTYTGGMFSDAEYEVYEDLKYDFDEAEALLDEVNQKTDAHIVNKSNPHGVTASQINAFTKAQTRTEIQTAVDAAKTEIDSTKADKSEVANALKGNANGEIVAMDDVSPITHGIKVKCSPGAKVTRAGKNLIPFPYPDFSYTANAGIAAAVQDDGGVLINGTATANVFINLARTVKYSSSNIMPNSTDGMITNGNINGVHLRYDAANTSTYIYIKSGIVCDNLVFYPQLEVGNASTEYEKGVPLEVYTVDEGGNVIIPALYPTTTLFTDVDGAIIEAEYNRDLNKSFGDIDSALDAILAIQDGLIGDYVSEEAEVINEGGDIV